MLKLSEIVNSINVASLLDEDQLRLIGDRVLIGYQEDLNSMSTWLSDAKRIEELTLLKSVQKNVPLPNSANIKLPIITKACYEYASSSIPEVIHDDKVVQAYIIGSDLTGSKVKAANKVTDFMNFQLLIEDNQWEANLHSLFFLTALYGFICTKTWYDPVDDRIKSQICNFKELIINCKATSLKEASRISEVLHLKLNDFVSAKNKKVDGVSIYLESTVNEIIELCKLDALDKPIDIIEQHCKLDLDEDGYAEPYIVTITKLDGCVLRIVPRFTKDEIKKDQGQVVCINCSTLFTDYHFLASPRGTFHSVGFGQLLLHITESANSCMNSLLDAARLSNMRGGYRDARLQVLPGGNSLHDAGEWKDVRVKAGASMKEGFFSIDYKEPSEVMYKLLGLLIDVSRDLTASAEINTGTQSSANAKTGATIALQQEGKKMVNSINKGIYRSLTKEFQHRFILNSKYIDLMLERDIYTQNPQIGKLLEISQKDFDIKKMVMFPIADPTLSSKANKMQNASIIMSLLQAGLNINKPKATEMILKATQIPDIESLIIPANVPAPPNPAVIKIQADIADKQMKRKIEQQKVQGHMQLQVQQQAIDAVEADANAILKKAQALNQVAQAEGVKTQNNLQDIKLQLAGISKIIDAQLGLSGLAQDQAQHVSGQQHDQNMQQQDFQNQQQMNQPQQPEGANESTDQSSDQSTDQSGSGGVAQQQSDQGTDQSNQ